MKIIGLTGPSGAGKGAAAAILARRGITVINADEVYREIISPPSACLDELRARFGSGIIAPGGTLDRAALRTIVFGEGNEEKLTSLNTITHKYVLAEVRARLAVMRESGAAAAVIDAPQLFESGFDRECDTVISVIADEKIRLGRVTQRDGISEETALRRFSAQLGEDYFIKHSDYIVTNNGGIDELETQLTEIIGREV